MEQLQIIKKENLRALLQKWHITLEQLAEAYGSSVETVKNSISGKEKIKYTMYKQEDFLQAIKQIFEKKGIYDLELFEAEINQIFFSTSWEEILQWIDQEKIDKLYLYWKCYEPLYSKIDEDSTIFLLRCLNLKETDSRPDKRKELLTYLQGFSCYIGKVQEILPVIQAFLNRENIVEKGKSDYKRASANRKNNEELRSIIRNAFEKIFYSDFEKGKILYCQRGKTIRENGIEFWQPSFVTEMDSLHWDLLVAYTMARIGDRKDRIRMVEIKLNNLME